MLMFKLFYINTASDSHVLQVGCTTGKGVLRMATTQLWASAEIFPGGRQSRHFAYSFSGCERYNAVGPSQNALSFLHRKENSPWKQALRLHFFEIIFRWSCIRVCEKVVLLSSFTAFAELGYRPISLLLWNAENWVWIGLELSTTVFAALTLVCAGWTTLLKI